ncbi:MAG TPA: hypothetical protein VK190_11345 [Pseudoneobacillus sp.]|nr:hypothetical protein [Pseudoneobacillus sp.]
MANNIYQLKYDDEVDIDIHDWLLSLPSNRKAEMVRHAIRYYLTYNGKGIVPLLSPPFQQQITKEEPKKKVRPMMDIGGSFS